MTSRHAGARATARAAVTATCLTLVWAGALAVSAAAAPQTAPVRPAAAAPAASGVYQDVYDGWKWWHVYCYRCHGVNAIATTMAPDLIDPNRRLTPAQFQRVVSRGNKDKGMPEWSALLDAKQIGQIHLYVRARADKVLAPGRPDEVGPNKGRWVPPEGWPKS